MNTKFTDDDLAKCARRELSQRRRVYARLVKEQKMDSESAGIEIAMMEQIAEYFEDKAHPQLFK